MDQSIIDKIQALLNRTEENGCTPSEVEEAAVAVERLLTKHALELADVVSAGKKQPDDVIAHKFAIHKAILDVNDNWWRGVVGAIARMMYCQPVVGGDWKRGFYAYTLGREVNAKAAEATIRSVMAYGEREAIREWELAKEEELAYASTANQRRNVRREYFRSYLMGFAAGVGQRSRQAQEKQQADVKVSAIVSTDKAAIDKKVEEVFGKLRLARGRVGSVSGDAYSKGAAAGRRASLGQKELAG